jgi:alkylhydroperoxidase family enzyme
MPYISQVDYAAASPEQRLAYDEELRVRGRMTNMKRTLLHSSVALRVYGEWFALRDELAPVLGDGAIIVFAYAICRTSGSIVGIAFMRRALRQMGRDPGELELTAAEAELVAFGEAIARNPQQIGDVLWAPLLARYSEKTLVDLVAFAGIMVATNLFTDAVGTRLDDELQQFSA